MHKPASAPRSASAPPPPSPAGAVARACRRARFHQQPAASDDPCTGLRPGMTCSAARVRCTVPPIPQPLRQSRIAPSHPHCRPHATPARLHAMASSTPAAAAGGCSAFGHPLGLEVVEVHNPQQLNFILGHAHFIKTVEDLYEALAQCGSGMSFGVAFCEASEGHGDMAGRRVRTDGNDPGLVELAARNAAALGAGHTFVVFLGEGCYPVAVLNAIKALPEVCRVHCATANPTAVLLATLGPDRKGVLGVVDGMTATALESEDDKAARHGFLRRVGYKR